VPKPKDEGAQFIEWAKRALRGVKDSTVFVCLFAPEFDIKRDAAYAIQLGAAILLRKPILVLAPAGVEVPPKLLAIADSVQYYARGDQHQLEDATLRGLTELGILRH
jgi:hypothetical protein